ncbi:hypothetical protein BGX23_002137 [Mortierella sp. AD031]|nr:hypothetical protein BGX23_002137 [Mortierella sp. AD031]
MASISTLVTSVDFYTSFGTLFALLSSYIFFKVYVLPNYVSPLRHIPGPPNKSKYNRYNIPCAGLFFDVLRQEAGVPYREWIEQYGGIVCYRGMFNTQNVLLADPQATQHVFRTHDYKYPKPDRVIRLMSSAIGKGLILVEGDVHRQQRKMIGPAFSDQNIKEMVPVMAVPAEYLGKMWEDRGLTRPGNNLVKAYSEYFSSSTSIIQFFRHMIPHYNEIPFRHNLRRKESIRAVGRVTSQIIREKRAQATSKDRAEQDGGKDLMSILMRANEQVGSAEDGKLTDAELKAQIVNFMAAGHETTSGAVTWMLHILSIHPEAQKKVRQEMISFTFDSLNALPYLSACIKELLRIIPPIHTTSRVASEDDTILGYYIPKGTQIYLSAAALHKLKSVYGEDVEEFKPERWMDPKLLTEQERRSTKFVTSDMSWAYIPFLTGPRNCIRSKFATIETKIILYYLLINLEYHPAPGF